MNVSEAIRNKRAIREFANQPLPDHVITTILDAGRRAASGGNLQPWHFIAIRERTTLQAVAQLGQWAGHLAAAPLGVLIVTPAEPRGWNMFDAGQAATAMQLAAWELGVGACIAGLFEIERGRELLGIPTDLEAQIAISFGYPAVPESLVRPPRQGGRRSLEDVVHWERW